ncbi:MAG: hypothetical protein ACPGXK_07690, partial [Phycisphaerae bacterium]
VRIPPSPIEYQPASHVLVGFFCAYYRHKGFEHARIRRRRRRYAGATSPKAGLEENPALSD